jgi:hypothetical protein
LQECGWEKKTLYVIFGVCNSDTVIVAVLKFVTRKLLVERL